MMFSLMLSIAHKPNLLDGGYELLRKASLVSVRQVRQVLDKGVSPNAKNQIGENVLWNLAGQPNERRFYDIIKLLVAKGASTEANRNGSTPLIAGSTNRNPWVLQAFLECGVKVNAADNMGGTALCGVLLGHNTDEALKAKERDLLPALQLLLKYKADPNKQWGRIGTLPLASAAYEGRLEACKLLVAAGAKVNASQTNLAYTSLHVACLRNRKSNATVVKYLISKGADLDAKDAEGRTPMQIATSKKFALIVEALNSK